MKLLFLSLVLMVATIIANILILIHHWKMDAMAHLVLIRYNYTVQLHEGEKKEKRKKVYDAPLSGTLMKV